MHHYGIIGILCFTPIIHGRCRLKLLILSGNNMRIHECEGRIEKSVPRITDWHHVACRVMTKGDHEGRIFSIASLHK